MAMIERLTIDAGDFLHFELDADEHTEDEVKTLINAFPSALSCLNDEDQWPIQAAACWNDDGRNAIPLIP